jgi:hypothetical protein
MESLVESFRTLLGGFATRDVCAWIAGAWFISSTDPLYLARKLGFTSPQRQTYYMLGLLMTTPDPKTPKELNDEMMARLVAYANEAELRYFDPYLGNEPPVDSPAKLRVALGAFVQSSCLAACRIRNKSRGGCAHSTLDSTLNCMLK